MAVINIEARPKMRSPRVELERTFMGSAGKPLFDVNSGLVRIADCVILSWEYYRRLLGSVKKADRKKFYPAAFRRRRSSSSASAATPSRPSRRA